MTSTALPPGLPVSLGKNGPRDAAKSDSLMQELPKDGPQDSEIIARVRYGEVNAFEILVHRYTCTVFRIVSRHAPRDKAEDLVQDTFVEAFRSLGSYSHKAPFSHWLSRVALRCCYGYWRSHRRSAEIPMSSLSEESENWMDRLLAARSREAFEAEAARSEAAEVLSYALDRLSPKDRMVLTLVHLEGHSVQEAASLLGWTVVSVKVRAHRSRTRLRKIILDLLDNRRSNR
jgi:RNA polymerase sigma-70 factor (ECF subfamily)